MQLAREGMRAYKAPCSRLFACIVSCKAPGPLILSGTLPTNRMVQVCKTLNAPIGKSRKKTPQVPMAPGENSSARFSK